MMNKKRISLSKNAIKKIAKVYTLLIIFSFYGLACTEGKKIKYTLTYEQKLSADTIAQKSYYKLDSIAEKLCDSFQADFVEKLRQKIVDSIVLKESQLIEK